MNYTKKLIWLIVIATLARLVLAGTQELSNVEAYYWSWAINPQWNYFDHPPPSSSGIYSTSSLRWPSMATGLPSAAGELSRTDS